MNCIVQGQVYKIPCVFSNGIAYNFLTLATGRNFWTMKDVIVKDGIFWFGYYIRELSGGNKHVFCHYRDIKLAEDEIVIRTSKHKGVVIKLFNLPPGP